MNDNLIGKVVQSWNDRDGFIHSCQEILDWISKLNRNTHVCVNECSINDSNFWFYDDYNGEILNRKRSFFSVKGLRLFVDNEFVSEQPMIFQPEIGYLGIICKEIDGVLHFLMQAKIEPGNVNCVQISPTIQATKSNFTRVHGGKLPAYFSYFEQAAKYRILYDQIQSEQASRFYKKRNRNMILLLDEEIEVLPNYRWMTLGQIKELMKVDNLVNMDTRTVLSGLPLVTNIYSDKDMDQIEQCMDNLALRHSIFYGQIDACLPQLYHKLNDYKMFHEVERAVTPLNQLVDWKVDERGITCKKHADFMVRFYDIEINGREVQHWTQPLFKALGSATFGLLRIIESVRYLYLVKIRPEIGSFDKIEVGPTIQWESTHYLYNDDSVEQVFRSHLEHKTGIITDVYLSEEGGRFYHEQNRNVIIEIDSSEIEELPEDYAWVDYATLNYLVQINNCLNIQLRNLMALIDFD